MNKKSKNLSWKEKNNEYLQSVQKFLDRADNIKDEKLKKDVIIAMLKCDKVLTKLAQKEINKNV